MAGSIVVGFMGVGKSTFVQQEYRRNQQVWNEEIVSDVDLDLGRDTPQNRQAYVQQFSQRTTTQRHSLVPAHAYILETLLEHQFPFTLVLPKHECLDEYLTRLIERGGSLSFLRYVNRNWTYLLYRLESRYLPHATSVIRLGPGEVLSDYIELLPDYSLLVKGNTNGNN